MKLGILGVGHIAEAILKGLLRTGKDPATVVLSPRGRGSDMAARYGFVLAADNAELVGMCDQVLLSVRPVDAIDALSGLPWRADQIVISACAGVTIDRLAVEAAPARIARIMPLTAAELGASPTVVYPMLPEIEPLLQAIGTTIPLSGEDQFEVATVSAAVYGWAQALIRTGTEWSARHGLEPETARQLMARTFVASGRIQSEQDAPMDEILASLLTPGGITEAGLAHIDQCEVSQAWEGACDVVLDKLTNKAEGEPAKRR